MSDHNGQRSAWQVVGVYLAGSWLCLQVVDVLADRIPLPSWTFLLTLVLLSIGLPITIATAYLQGFLVRRTAGVEERLHHRVLTWRNVVRGGVAALAVWGIAVTGWLVTVGRSSASHWDVVTGLAEIERLVGESKFEEAYAIAEQLDPRLDSDSVRAGMWAQVSVTAGIESDPSGARVFRRAYAPADAEWREVGRTPIDSVRLPLGVTRLRFELGGHRTHELAVPASRLPQLGVVELHGNGELPEEMVYVPGAPAAGAYALFAPGLEQVAPVDVHDFHMARHEVTNREYREFVAAGGYTDRTCWPEPFVLDGRTLTFDEAMTHMRDATGRAGPATWDAGSYPRGRADHPVGGVSWYEAAAYACWRGMALPTVYHWFRAAHPVATSPHVVPLSNFGDGPARVGSYQGVSWGGIHDLAGNVREWTQNAQGSGEARFLLGGGWDDQPYAFNDAVTARAFDRSPMNGIRLTQYPDTTSLGAARAPLTLAFRDYRAETPVGDDVFELYRQMYAYDGVPLNARISATDTAELWIRQRVELDAGYGGERLTTFVFLPRDRAGPHQTVVYFPGSNVIYSRSNDDVSIGTIDFVLLSGRAVILPIFKGTFERGSELSSDIQDTSNSWRDHMIAWSKDMRRSIDYAATREDLAVDQLSYLGISWGSAVAPVMVALEPRIRANVLIAGGLLMQQTQPIVDPFNFLPRVTQPTIMLSARYDSFYPLETAGRPFYDNLGTPSGQRKLVIYDANHGVLGYARNAIVRETLDWLDQYVGPVPRNQVR
ncbi:MAG TPA: SUMF1/EgtB/PvdO family nonheme iron enzyme [Longimicrobiales bacterium]